MFKKLGVSGVLGVLVTLGGLGLVAYEAPLIAGGLALVLAGIALVAFALVKNALSSLGMGAMV